MKVYSALFADAAHLDRFGEASTVVLPEDIKEDGILILHGGEDIATSIYNQTPGSYTNTYRPSRRDMREMALVARARELGLRIFGICRGAQLLTALAGGSLVQDVRNHTRSHLIETTSGERMEVTSAHHQMCNPKGTNHELLAWSYRNLSPHYMGEYDKEVEMDCEPEVIYYPDLKALAVQPHPEWMPDHSEFVQYLFKLVEEKLL